MSKENYPKSKNNYIVSIGSYFGDKAIEEVRQANGGKKILSEPVPKEERTPPTGNKSKRETRL